MGEHVVGPAELGGRVGTATVPGYAAPGTPLHDAETWQGRNMAS